MDVKRINDGFAAIAQSTAADTRWVKLSYDGGISWQPIKGGLNDRAVIDSIWLPAQNDFHMRASITSIIKAGAHLFCTHPDGIFKSADEGVTWQLILPSVDGKVFHLAVSGNVIYAIPRNAGC